MNYKLLFLLGFVLFGVAFTVPEKVAKKADKVIGKFYDVELFYKEMVPISEADNVATVAEFGNENLFKIMRADEFLGYGYIGNAPSKTASFDYLVLFDENFIISKSKVLIYREEYGGEIGSKRWLRQFEGNTVSSPEFKYNENIIPISGATISVQSMTRAMNELLQSLGTLQERNSL